MKKKRRERSDVNHRVVSGMMVCVWGELESEKEKVEEW